MQLYDAWGPNPRAMRMFLAEKGITIPSTELDILKGDNRKPPYTDRNPGGQVPALELDNGKCIGETVAIWEYLEEKHPTPALIGANAEERAEARMWQRRVEMQITEHLYNGFRYSEGLPVFTRSHALYPRGGSRAQGNRAGQAQVARPICSRASNTSRAIASLSPTSFCIARSTSAPASSSRSIRRSRT